MKSFALLSLSLMLLVGVFSACEKEICTLELRTIGIVVEGDSLTDYYTIRQRTSDTIRTNFGSPNSDTWYPVLSDGFDADAPKSVEVFTFIGEINDSIVVQEPFLIQSDGCHIEKRSGKSLISL